ncbi:STAS domain-containing protein [Rhodocyclus tenuis]|uniref:Anti-anti-sigma regulatory factor n=1 Tax=Rhodocyclus tenuis TaxID=1066 RepID=A0A840FV63_RHOTE|nr:STAS domain-containing protein [Rhodocyclus tenuis]MBB4245987.1 anti-anti-sigma regulatory factor [Rhodocyclus tenuis]
MVFSFFKKAPEKMLVRPPAEPTRPAAKPAPAEPPTEVAAARKPAATPAPTAPVARQATAPAAAPGKRAATAAPAAPARSSAGATQRPAPAPASESHSLEFTDFSFSDATSGVLVEDAIDPIDADAEQGAMLWANAQVEAARAFLEDSVRTHRAGPGERLWLMLFDLYRLSGRAADFEALGIDYAQAFEKSPPIWRGALAPVASGERPAAAKVLPLSGALLGADAPALVSIAAALKKSPRIAVDVGALSACDSAGCAALLAQLGAARRAGGDIAFVGAEALAEKLSALVEPGRDAGAESWLLLLELLQQIGNMQVFENTAIAYAVTFEISPPSWDARAAARGPAASAASAGRAHAEAAAELKRQSLATINAADGDCWCLAGDLRNARFSDLPVFAATHERVLIDCTRLERIDFVSAGALFNTLESLRRAGKRVVFREPNHLVSELLAVFGVPALAEIVNAQR